MSNTPPPSSNQPPPPAWRPAEGICADRPWWKRWWGISLIGVGALVVLGSLVGEPDDDTDAVAVVAVADASTETASPTEPASPSETTSPSPTPSKSSPSPSRSPSPTPTPSPEPTPDTTAVRSDDAPVVLAGVVTNVVDGDTLDLDDGTRIRLAIVDTPEVHGGKEPCGAEASALTRRTVLGEHVSILRPSGAPRMDSFDRMVGEVVHGDGVSLNVQLVAAGLGSVDERFTSEDADLAARLRDAQRGAASPSCGTVAAPPPPAPKPEPEPEPAPAGGNCAPGYDPCLPPYPPDLNCSDVNGPIRVDHAHGDPHGFDRDKDGIGCEV